MLVVLTILLIFAGLWIAVAEMNVTDVERERDRWKSMWEDCDKRERVLATQIGDLARRLVGHCGPRVLDGRPVTEVAIDKLTDLFRERYVLSSEVENLKVAAGIRPKKIKPESKPRGPRKVRK